MEEITVHGLVAGGEDFGESDRLVKLLTAELGVITVRMRGVKKEKAKLKYAAMPFSLCEYVLMKRGGFYSLKTASPIESLFSVTYDPDKYVVGSIMLETAAAGAGITDSADIFVRLLTALKALIYSETDPFSLGLNFVFSLLISGGYAVPSANEKDFYCPIEEQKSLPDKDVAKYRLKKYIGLFEKKFYTVIKSAALL